MQPDFSQIGPFLIAAVVAFAIYRRFRRNFGRQPLRRARMIVRMALLAVAASALLPMALRSAQFSAAEFAGAAIGIALGVWGAQRTRFLTDGGQLYYVPHTYTGIAVSLLFLSRLAYRVVQIYTGATPPSLTGAANHSPASPASMVSSPLTVGIVFVLVGYYAWYYGWLLWKSKRLTAADFEASPEAASAVPTS
jgi:hypothetical protein